MRFSSPRRPDAYRSRFDPDALKVLEKARREATRLGFGYLGPEHLLLGLLGDPHPGLSRLLVTLGIRVTDLRTRVERLLSSSRLARDPTPKGRGKPKDLPYTSRTRKVFELAVDHARQSGEPMAGPVHLLLGLIAEGRSAAQEALVGLGATLEKARSAAVGVLPVQAPLQITIDDASDRLIYDQIVEQIREAVAIGHLRPGDRLPAIRQLADDLGIAPGTVARAYTRLEGAGVVVTDGARGTFVAVPGQQAPSDARHPAMQDLLRPVVVAAFHLGLTPEELRAALDAAMGDIFSDAA